jgi:hypothetical protein
LFDTGDASKDVPITEIVAMEFSWAIGTSHAYSDGHTTTARARSPKITWLMPVGPPSEPEELSLSAASASSVSVSWSPPQYEGSSAVESYNVRLDDGGPSIDKALSTTHTFSGLASDSPYVVQVQAINSKGAGNWVSLSVRTLPDVVEVPSTPLVGPEEVSASQEEITVSWTEPDLKGLALISYTVEYSADGNTWQEAYTGVMTSSTVTGLTPDTQYQWRFLATTGAGSSGLSPVTTISTTAYAACPSSCSNNGACVKGVCQCQEGYLSVDCSVASEAKLQACWDSGKHCIHWSYDDTHLYVQLVFTTEFWAGVIWGGEGGMKGDCWMADVLTDGTVDLSDRFSTGDSQPSIDADQHLLDGTAYRYDCTHKSRMTFVECSFTCMCVCVFLLSREYAV